MTGNGAKCFRCGLMSMPRWTDPEAATARACQNPDCRAVEIREPDIEVAEQRQS